MNMHIRQKIDRIKIFPIGKYDCISQRIPHSILQKSINDFHLSIGTCLNENESIIFTVACRYFRT